MEAPMQSFGAPRRRTAVVGDYFGPYGAPLTEKVGMERPACFPGAHQSLPNDLQVGT